MENPTASKPTCPLCEKQNEDSDICDECWGLPEIAFAEATRKAKEAGRFPAARADLYQVVR